MSNNIHIEKIHNANEKYFDDLNNRVNTYYFKKYNSFIGGSSNHICFVQNKDCDGKIEGNQNYALTIAYFPNGIMKIQVNGIMIREIKKYNINNYNDVLDIMVNYFLSENNIIKRGIIC